MKKTIKIFKALGDSNRVRILKMLEEGKLCVCEITAVLDLAPSTVSKHLSILRDAGFIEDEKNGKWVDYMIAEKPENNLISDLLKLVKETDNDDKTIKDDLERLKDSSRFLICDFTT
jgi:ArsR family transcriptional regulator, arsenate/arsenite/antimonite-responsive transcriptional repressor